MLWRKPISTKKLEVSELGPLKSLLPVDRPNSLLIGGTNPNFVIQGRIWMKLAHSHGLGDRAKWVLVQEVSRPTDLTSCLMALPRSEHPYAFAVADPNRELLDQLGDHSERDSFAIVVHERDPILAYIGAPTEDVWEAVENALRGGLPTDLYREFPAP